MRRNPDSKTHCWATTQLAIDAINHQILADNPGASIREISIETKIPVSTIWHIFTTPMG
jgi:hypothetical protein